MNIVMLNSNPKNIRNIKLRAYLLTTWCTFSMHLLSTKIHITKRLKRKLQPQKWPVIRGVSLLLASSVHPVTYNYVNHSTTLMYTLIWCYTMGIYYMHWPVAVHNIYFMGTIFLSHKFTTKLLPTTWKILT